MQFGSGTVREMAGTAAVTGTSDREDWSAGRFASLFTTMPSWVHRRVETIEFTDDASVKRHISVDFTLPAWVRDDAVEDLPQFGVPIAFLRKTTLESLSVRGASGGALPLLTTRQNGSMAVGALVMIALTTLEAAGHYDPVAGAEMMRADLEAIVFGKGADGLAAFEILASRIRAHRRFGMQLSSLGDDFLDVARQFATSFLFTVPFASPPTSRTIIKFEYVEHLRDSEDERRWPERVADRMGWTRSTYRFDLPGVVAAESFHFELTVPDGASICEGAIQSDDQSDDATNFILSRRGGPTLHMTDSESPRKHREVSINLRASRDGWLRTCMVASFLITILMAGSGLRLHELFARDSSGDVSRVSSVDAAAVLLTLVAVAGAFVVRLDEHALTSRILSWLRGTALVAVAAPFVGAWVLAFGPSGHPVTVIWWILTGLDAACSLALVGAYAGPRLLPVGENDVQ